MNELVGDGHQLMVRLNYSIREFEVRGSPTDVSDWVGRLSSLLDADPTVVAEDAARVTTPASPPTEALAINYGSGGSDGFPANFGEYFHRFRTDITDVDRMLIAGHFLEQSSDGRVFTTAEANRMLKEQGVRVTNPSEALRRNLSTRRVFKVTGRDFRTARPAGVDQLRTLLLAGSTLD